MMKKLICMLAALGMLTGFTPLMAEGETETTEETAEENTEETEEAKPEITGPDIQGVSSILIDAASGTVLARKDSARHVSPAALTKSMGVYLAVSSLKNDQLVTMSSDAFQTYDHSSGVIWILEEESVPAIDLEYASLMQNANDTMAMLAEAVSGTPEAFVAKMNSTAAELGMVNTQYSNIFGVYDEGHYTCAEDLAILTRKAMRDTSFSRIYGTPAYRIAPTALQSNERLLAANCEMLRSGADYYSEAQGCQIGYTRQDGYVLTAAATRNGLDLIAVVLGTESEADAYEDAHTLFEYGFSHFQNVEITPEAIGTKTVEIYENSKHVADVTFSVEQGFSALLSSGVDRSALKAEIVTRNEETNNPNLIEAEVVFTLEGQQVGTAEMKKKITTYDTAEVKKSSLLSPRQIFDYFCIAVLAGILIIKISHGLTPPAD